MYFDASDLNLSSPIAAFAMFNDPVSGNPRILLALDRAVTVTGPGKVYPQDIILFTPTSLGDTTAGTFSIYFDGSDVGMEKAQEAIKTIFRLSDGSLIIGTKGAASVPGLTAAAEDLMLFKYTGTPGPTTTGTWSLYFDGSAAGMMSTTKVDAIAVTTNGLYLSTAGLLTSGGLTTDNEDVFVCAPPTSTPVTTCSSPSLYFDGSLWGLAADNVDGISLP